MLLLLELVGRGREVGRGWDDDCAFDVEVPLALALGRALPLVLEFPWDSDALEISGRESLALRSREPLVSCS